MLAVVTPLQPVMVPMMLGRQPAVNSPVLAARQTIIVRTIVPPLQSIVLPIMAIVQSFMTTVTSRRIALMR
jgi:hypothetical protein